MLNFTIKTDTPWYGVAIRVALVLITVCIIVWCMPSDSRPNFKIEKDKVWFYNDLTSTFEFPVYKSETTIQADREQALIQYEPYYTYDKEVAAVQERLVTEKLSEYDSALSPALRQIVISDLKNVYEHGIIDTKKPFGEAEDSTRCLRRIDEKEATSIDLCSVLTPVQAYEIIMSDPRLASIHDVLKQLNLNDILVPNLIYDEARSESIRQELLDSVPLYNGYVQSGQKIISHGELVTKEKYQILKSYMKEADRQFDSNSPIKLGRSTQGRLLYVLIVISMFSLYVWIYRRDYFDQLRPVIMIFVHITGAIVLASVLVSHNLMHVYIIPFAIVPIFIRVFMDSRTAFMAHLAVVLICAVILQRPLEFITVEIAAGLTAIISLRELTSRSQLFLTACITTAVAMLTNLAVFLIRSNNTAVIDSNEYLYLTICGIIVFCSYPMLYLIEKTFGFVSDITLIELSDMNKDLLRRMSEVASGTFNHSIMVGNLAAEIARKIGGNAQLVRTGALYHDIGKIQNPIYFTENQSGGLNPHDQLSYEESAKIIISHVTEGLKLADKYNLPQPIRELIATHHGQGKVQYFYIKYKNEHPDEPIDDLQFTYPGPNPYTKEQAILMMADTVEAASRSLPDYTDQSIRTLVNKIIDGQVEKGFFRECPITFREIQYAKTVLIEKLKTIYHTRISYPEIKK